MILPCRILQPRSQFGSLPLALLFAAFSLVFQPGRTWSQNAVGSSFEQAGLGWLPAIPIQINATLDLGYDDNVSLSSSGQGSAFTSENVVLTYARPGQRTQFFVVGVGSFSQYFDVSGQNETSGNVT